MNVCVLHGGEILWIFFFFNICVLNNAAHWRLNSKCSYCFCINVFFDVESNVIIFGWKSLEALGNLEMFLLAIFC